MARSNPTHLGYGFLIIIAFLLTMVALFTPGWRTYRGDGAPDFGLISRYCGRGNRKVNDFDCSQWAKSKLPFEKATLGLVIIAVIFQLMAIGCFFTLFSPRMRLQLPAVTLCFLAFVSLLAAIVVYGVRYDKKIAYLSSVTYELLADVRLGYSYYIALAAMIINFFAVAAAGGSASKASSDID